MKSFAFVVLLAGVVTFSGCGEKVEQLKEMKDDVTSKVESGKQMVDENKGMLGGLKDAMKNGVAMKCVMSDDNGGEWITYTNGKNMRSEGMMGDKTQVVLVIDGTTYSWEKGSKKGEMMDAKCLEEFQKDMGLGEGDIPEQEYEDSFSFEDLEAEEDAGNAKCSPSTDADFSVPSDIVFTDQCKIMKEQMDNLKLQMQGV